MKLHKHPLNYRFSPPPLTKLACEFIEFMKGPELFELWIWEGTPFLYQIIEGVTWALGMGRFSTIEDEDIHAH